MFILFQSVEGIDSLVVYHVLVAYYHVNFMLLLAKRLLLFCVSLITLEQAVFLMKVATTLRGLALHHVGLLLLQLIVVEGDEICWQL